MSRPTKKYFLGGHNETVIVLISNYPYLFI